ncbi:MAG: SUMF1/EgtB/PvdO family nonheme iron enzyme [Polyangiaceae bacterium]
MVGSRIWSVLLASGWMACSGQTSSSHDGASTATEHHAADPQGSAGFASDTAPSSLSTLPKGGTDVNTGGYGETSATTGGVRTAVSSAATGNDAQAGSSQTGSASPCAACGPLERCWNGQLCVARMVTVPSAFSIDATEVTRSQYDSWLASSPSPKGQDGVCAWNSTFRPDAACMARSSVCQGPECRQHPQPCVDQCDATAYCRAVGKRLCGAVPSGSVVSLLATNGQWQNACTSNGAQSFVYGDSFQPEWCNDSTSRMPLTEPVASRALCQSKVIGYRRIYDLIGNVWEWEDNCIGNAGQADVCNPRGASFGISAAMPNCEQGIPIVRNTAAHNVGFRCCSL